MKTCWPLPFSAQPTISYWEQPFPIPIVWTLENLLLRDTILMTPSVLETHPSVRRNICFGYPSIGFWLTKLYKGSYICVPPKLAPIVLTRLTASLTSLSLYLLLFGNRLSCLEPKLITLKYVSSGKLLMKRIRAYLAFYILAPPIDPLLSSRNMYSPFPF